ncbi:SIMPL domain-containing protein [Muribaculum sp.]|uniref:SIMPL domain-containing protein n=1 Tax=Muribaculum sp. TaxID=1918611 RepID=UPI0023C5B797|nr:SIMPL domain-containing protein [Muribaculum sp.]MDE5704850.1 SIMPL domain-containing protein [Muribaculum sp.]
MLTRTLPALLIAAGIFFLGVFIKSGIDNFAYRDRVVAVRGLAEKEVMANKVTWPIVCKEVGNDLTSIYDKITSNTTKISKFLTDNGISSDEILVQPPQILDLQAERYGSNDRPFRYNVTSVVVVTSPNVEKVNKLISRQTELLKQGIAITAGDYEYRTIYEYTALNDIKPEMIAEATANAREAADKFAADSKSRLGKIKTASQGQFDISDRDPYTPYLKKVRVVSTIVFYLED